MERSNVRPPAVAGAFYPADAGELAAMVDGFMDEAGIATKGPPKALIAPHAGYVYSGPVAGSAYAQLRGRAAGIRRVLLLGPADRIAPAGIAAPASSAFATPLGRVPVDAPARDRTSALRQVTVEEAPHALEHSLEVHLPFLQRVLGLFHILPLLVGDATEQEVEEVLDALWGGPETLVVVSSDLSHYHDFVSARRRDRATADAIESLRPDGIGADGACGNTAVRALLRAAKRREMQAVTLDLRNSGDTRGPRDEVVGYGAWAFLGA